MENVQQRSMNVKLTRQTATVELKICPDLIGVQPITESESLWNAPVHEGQSRFVVAGLGLGDWPKANAVVRVEEDEGVLLQICIENSFHQSPDGVISVPGIICLIMCQRAPVNEGKVGLATFSKGEQLVVHKVVIKLKKNKNIFSNYKT